MTDIYLSDALKALPSVFLMEPDAIAGLNSFWDLCITTQVEKLFIRRVIATFDFGDYIPQTASVGRFSISEFLEKVTLIYEENSNSFSRMSAIESPSDLLEQRDAEIEQMSGTETVELVLIDGKWLRLEPLTQENINIRPEMPSIQSDRLTISSEPSVWNHFKMCASIASSNDNPVVSLLTTEYGTIQIHASNDHEEYRAEIILVGGEPPSRQAIGIPVALINEVSYWMETGLHTESHLDIWFDENHVKFGTRSNQVLTEIEEYQSQKFGWSKKPQTKTHRLTEKEIPELVFAIGKGLSMIAGYIPLQYAPIVELSVLHGLFSVENSNYHPSLNAVAISIPELLDFSEFVLTNEHDLEVKVEVDTQANHVIFHGESFSSDGKPTRFSYLILGVLCGCSFKEEEGCLNIPGHYNAQLLPDSLLGAMCEWTEPCEDSYEDINFIERMPLDTGRRSERSEKHRQSLAKQECPAMILRREARQLIKEMEAVQADFDDYMICTVEKEDKPFGVDEHQNAFKKRFPQSYEDFVRLGDAIFILNRAVEQRGKTEMFNPQKSKAAIALLEEAISKAKWTHFRFQNKHSWGDNPHLWQQTF